MAGCWCLEGVIFLLLSLFSVSTIALCWYNWGRLEYYWFQKYKTCFDLIINLQSEWNEKKLTSHQNVSSEFDHVPKFSCCETEFPSAVASGWGKKASYTGSRSPKEHNSIGFVILDEIAQAVCKRVTMNKTVYKVISCIPLYRPCLKQRMHAEGWITATDGPGLPSLYH